jgi:DNA uptake protein ComE-like DNA-binding protein
MFRRWLREYYMLGRGEQRALLILATILFLSLVVRVTVRLLPGKDPPGMAGFMKEHREILAALARQDSLDKAGNTPVTGVGIPGPPASGYKVPAASFRLHEPININRADSSLLLGLPGIGPVFSARIIKYRDLLGGFVSIRQLGEVYGLPGETVERIRNSILIDTAAIRRLYVNRASFSELLRHPYLEYADVKALVHYRDFRGRIGSVQEIRDNRLLGDSTLERIIPYLDFNR